MDVACILTPLLLLDAVSLCCGDAGELLCLECGALPLMDRNQPYKFTSILATWNTESMGVRLAPISLKWYLIEPADVFCLDCQEDGWWSAQRHL